MSFLKWSTPSCIENFQRFLVESENNGKCEIEMRVEYKDMMHPYFGKQRYESDIKY